MGRIFHITDEELDYEGYGRGFGRREVDEERLLEKAFKEGCEHGYKKAMRELEGFNERSRTSRPVSYREGFEEKLERIKRKFD